MNSEQPDRSDWRAGETLCMVQESPDRIRMVARATVDITGVTTVVRRVDGVSKIASEASAQDEALARIEHQLETALVECRLMRDALKINLPGAQVEEEK